MARHNKPNVGYDKAALIALATIDGLMSPAASIRSKASLYRCMSATKPIATAAQPSGTSERACTLSSFSFSNRICLNCHKPIPKM